MGKRAIWRRSGAVLAGLLLVLCATGAGAADARDGFVRVEGTRAASS